MNFFIYFSCDGFWKALIAYQTSVYFVKNYAIRTSIYAPIGLEVQPTRVYNKAKTRIEEILRSAWKITSLNLTLYHNGDRCFRK